MDSLFARTHDDNSNYNQITMDLSKEVKRKWYIEIVRQCALNFDTGFISSFGNPFDLFREYYPNCPKRKDEALHYMKRVAEANDLTLPPYFYNVEKTAKRKRKHS